MELLLEPIQICNPENYPNIDDLQMSISKINSNYSLSRKLYLIWQNISDFYLTKFVNISSSDIFKNKLKTELLLRTLSMLSTYTSPFIEGVNNFLMSSNIGGEKSKLTYDNKKSFDSFTKHLMATQPEHAREGFFSALGNTHSYYTFIPLQQSDLIINDTPLAEFVFTHLGYRYMYSSCENKDIILVDHQDYISDLFEGTGKNITHIFKKEGRYLLSVLLYAIGTKQIPYTQKTLSGVPLSSINKLFKVLHKSYYQEEVHSKQFEQLLFLINTEYIFQPSLLKKIFLTCKNNFDTMSVEALPEFSYILSYLPLFRSCPLITIKLELWNYFSDLHFNEPDNVKDTVPGQSLLQSQLNLTQELANYFSYALLTSSKCWDSIENMNKLKTDILEFLSIPNNCDISWSLLSNKNSSNMQIPSIFNDYFDFYILYYFYNQKFAGNTFWSQTDYECFSIWNEYNLYVKYLFARKKQKKS